MKIGIITIVKVNNYGAELQAFALQKKLELAGFQSEIIDYLYYKNWRFKDTKASRPFVALGAKGKVAYWVKYRLLNFILEKVLAVVNGNVRRRMMRFEDFHRQNTRFSRTYYSMPQLYGGRSDYDVFVVGSDQVWNPSAGSSIEPYFLTFAPKEAKKISYASSFGVPRIVPELQERFKNLLGNIDVISVRETSGVELVRQLAGREAALVADPTLLLTKQEWIPYMKAYPGMPERYVLVYQLSASDAIVNLANRIGKERGIPVYRICKRAFKVEKNAGIVNILDAGPAEFLSLIANAEFVVTNSFHGTAFSVNFHVPFYTVVSSTKKNNARMESLLSLTGLKDRMVLTELSDSVIIDVPSFQNEQLDELRKHSLGFLQDCLGIRS